MTVPVEIGLAALAAAMALATAWLVRRAAEARTRLEAVVVLFLLGMMGAMLLGGLVYAAHPSRLTAEDALWVGAVGMSLSALPVVAVGLREAEARARAGPAFVPTPLVHGPWVTASAIVLVLGNELLMGATFPLASGARLAAPGSGLVPLLGGVVNSPWFLFTMAAEMALTTVLLRHRLSRAMLAVLGFQSAIMALSPTALAGPLWRGLSVYGGSAAMIALFVVLLDFVYRHRALNAAFARYLVRLLAVYAGMMAGLFLWLLQGEAELFALFVVLEMLLYFAAVLRTEPFVAADRFSWMEHPRWTVGLLLTIFLAELFMGAVLDLQALGPSFVALLPTAPLSGGGATALGNAVANGFWFTALVTNSTWFLAMMGAEMGALVVAKYRETRQREQKVRLALLMGSYAAAAVYFPSVYYRAAFPTLPSGAAVPVLGWNMGIGSAPIGPSVFLVLFLTYAILGSLTFLFGRRAVCSVFCTAPLMFQGTTIDAMRSFQRTAPIARKFLGSRLSRAYRVTSGTVMASLVGASLLSYFDQTGRIHVTVGGADPTVFLYALYFSVLWYVLFVTIPYVGTYNCVTMGWCYTGLVSGLFQRLGPYKLAVRDRSVCRSCPTVDCAKACPVGLVDMAGHFRTKGEFRSSKCCGVGNCVGACPYGNLYIYDIRHWIRSRRGRRSDPAPTARLPVLGARPRAGPAPTVPPVPRTARAVGGPPASPGGP